MCSSDHLDDDNHDDDNDNDCDDDNDDPIMMMMVIMMKTMTMITLSRKMTGKESRLVECVPEIRGVSVSSWVIDTIRSLS